MSAATATLAGRRAAARQMIDTCTVTREDKSQPRDERTGKYPTTTVYQGRAKSQTYEGYEQNPEAGGHTYTVQRYAVHFPAGAFIPEVGDQVEWTACTLSPERVGTVERVTAPFDKTFHTALRVFVDRTAEA